MPRPTSASNCAPRSAERSRRPISGCPLERPDADALAAAGLDGASQYRARSKGDVGSATLRRVAWRSKPFQSTSTPRTQSSASVSSTWVQSGRPRRSVGSHAPSPAGVALRPIPTSVVPGPISTKTR